VPFRKGTAAKQSSFGCPLPEHAAASLNELVESGAVLSVTLRKPGAKRGIKLINRAALLDYLHHLEHEQMKGKEARHEA